MPLRVVEGIPITPQPPPTIEELEVTEGSGAVEPLGFESFSSRRLRHFPQLRSQWCWAACAQMVADYFGSSVSQCSLARSLFNENNCCASGFTFNSDCDRGCNKEDVANVIYPTLLQMTVSPRPIAIRFPDIIEEITVNRRPVLVGLKWTAAGRSGGHLVVISGYSRDADPENGWLTVNDPLEGEAPMMEVRYSYLKSAYGLGEWRDTWVNISKN